LPREIVALRLTPAQVAALEARGFVLIARSPGPLAVGDLFRFEVPSTLNTAEGLRLARGLAPGAVLDFNHVYRPAQAPCRELFCQQRRTIRWPQPPNECRVEASIGLVDTSVDVDNPALAGQKVTVLDGVSGGRPLASVNHGTAIAALLVGRSDAAVPGLLPRSEVVTIQAFHKSEAGEDIADTFDVVSSIDTLMKRGLKVINLSFTGPNNRLLAEIVGRATREQTLLVAAAGNRGPNGPVVYPAGYESVVAVTAVGEDLRIYRGANRGKFVDFAAPGVKVQVVSAKVETRFETGTSFAAPFITAALAASRARQPSASPVDLVAALQVTATDLGKPGRDPIFGWGLVQVPEICP
jgi:subtilisin family serine protease